ncbi:MAG: hypothetical protein A2Z37_03610 [Chloroflexi bacterium RBG_19FT_COMBO_62_14]|nr:MAG: hypothetical protein A2Z37_03610 [Chloroflexi bacterium RBG_19FT_COMBO_62_14]
MVAQVEPAGRSRLRRLGGYPDIGLPSLPISQPDAILPAHQLTPAKRAFGRGEQGDGALDLAPSARTINAALTRLRAKVETGNRIGGHTHLE